MLKRYGLKVIASLLVINMLIAVLMLYAVKPKSHPEQSNSTENVYWHDNLNTNARWVAGTTACNPRIVLCH
jgi:hypothetical protein